MREKEGQKKAKAPAPLRNKIEFISRRLTKIQGNRCLQRNTYLHIINLFS